MYSLMESTGSNMPMKMVPMNPAIKNSISRLGERHGGFQVAVQGRSR